MPSSRLLAFFVDWWINYRDVDPVRRAFRRADVEHWHPLIDATLKKNKELHRRPSSWIALAHILGRDPTTVFRIYKSGESEPRTDDLRSIAMILGLDVTDFLMTNRDRIAKAAKILCKGKVQLFETTAYFVYREKGSADEDIQLDPRRLREVISIVKQIGTVQKAESSIRNVGRCLESSLQEAQNKWLRKHERYSFEPNGQGMMEPGTRSPRQVK
jgi:hypothetical protein